ncbi:MAG: cell wall hydrolase [Caulobacter sp. 35-67-4]|nr:MAG: cell wall hydrolase [Caulobacter sp. 35-67-4]
MRGDVDGRAILGWLKVRRLSKLGVVGLVALVLAGVSAQAAIRAIVDQRVKVSRSAPAPTGYESQDHFPGAAYFYATEEEAPVPTQGATGTIALPDLPLPPEAALKTPDTSIRPAAPFSMAHASAVDRARALQCLTTAIYYEAATEPDAGQQAVAQVILNRARHPAFPATVCGVVFQGSEHAGCQFSFACDGSMGRGRERGAWNRAQKIASRALSGAVMNEVGSATHFHTTGVSPGWGPRLLKVAQVGMHVFYRFGGRNGAPGAFSSTPRPSTLDDLPNAPEIASITADGKGMASIGGVAYAANAVATPVAQPAQTGAGMGGPLGQATEPASAPAKPGVEKTSADSVRTPSAAASATAS